MFTYNSDELGRQMSSGACLNCTHACSGNADSGRDLDTLGAELAAMNIQPRRLLAVVGIVFGLPLLALCAAVAMLHGYAGGGPLTSLALIAAILAITATLIASQGNTLLQALQVPPSISARIRNPA